MCACAESIVRVFVLESIVCVCLRALCVCFMCICVCVLESIVLVFVCMCVCLRALCVCACTESIVRVFVLEST